VLLLLDPGPLYIRHVDVRITGIAIALSLAVAGAGTLVGVLAADDQAEVDRLFEQAQASARRVAGLETELRRTQAERNRLDAQLAAEDAPPVCPNAYVSSGDGVLFPTVTLDYPCGWHVVRNASMRVDHPDIQGITAEITWFSQLPIPLEPSAGLIADIEMSDWVGTGGEDDPLPSLADWLDLERAAYTDPPSEARFEGPQDRTIHRFVGPQTLLEQPVNVVVMVWSYLDPLTGLRHIVRAMTAEPTRIEREALEHLARSFTVPVR